MGVVSVHEEKDIPEGSLSRTCEQSTFLTQGLFSHCTGCGFLHSESVSVVQTNLSVVFYCSILNRLRGLVTLEAHS